MARKVVVFDKFTGGEFGKMSGLNSPPNSFHASNMLVYSTGQIGVRAGIKEKTPSGVPVGIILGFGNTPVPTKDAWFTIGNTVYTFDMLNGNNLLTATGSTAGTATTIFDSTVLNTDVYITAKGKTNSYMVTVNTGAGVPAAVSTLTGSPSGRAITVYGQQLIIGDITGSLAYNIRYSAASNFNSWPAANFEPIGDGWFINGLHAQRQHLVVTKQNGFYVLTGVPGDNLVIRKVSNDFGPLGSAESTIGLNDLMYTYPIFGTQPGSFNGSRANRMFHLANHFSFSGTGDVFPPTNGVTALTDTNHGAVWLEKTTNKMIALINGVYSYHTFGVNISGFTSKYGGTGGLVVTTDGGSAGTSGKFYVWDSRLDRPGIEGQVHDRAGDASATPVTGTLQLPEYWERGGEEFYVKTVLVEFTKWNTGGNANNHFDLVVTAKGTYQGGDATSNTVSFDESPASSSASGTQARRIFGFGEQQVGNGFQLDFTNIRGIAFDKIEVILETRPARV